MLNYYKSLYIQLQTQPSSENAKTLLLKSYFTNVTQVVSKRRENVSQFLDPENNPDHK